MNGCRMLVVGASAGIGREIARAAVEAGAAVVFAARRKDRLTEAVAEAGGGIPMCVDVTKPDECQLLGPDVVSALGGLDVVVYASGVSPLLRARDASREAWLHALEVNTIGLSLVARSCVSVMSPDAVLLYLSSESVGWPRHGGLVYQASKAAAEEALAVLRVEHPELRFANVVVGATLGTEIGADRDPALQAELATEWVRRGLIRDRFLTADRLGRLIVAMLAPVLAYPEAQVNEIRIEAGGRVLGGADQVIAAARGDERHADHDG